MRNKTAVYSRKSLQRSIKSPQRSVKSLQRSVKSLQRSIKSLTFGLLATCTSSVFADIEFEDRGSRFSLDVRDEPIAKVMDHLSERFDFKVDGYPEHWSDDPMNFSATGDLERVLRSLLKDTSHVFEYHTDLDTRETRIASLKLLNEGVDGFVPTQQARTDATAEAQAALSSARASSQPGYNESTNRQPKMTEPDLATDGQANVRQTAADQSRAAASNASRPSGLSQSLEARARLSSAAGDAATNGTQAASGTAAASAPGFTPGEPNADMQALTQKALQDVKGLADALRKAEGK